MNRIKVMGLIAVLCILVLFSGCRVVTVRGGGWLPSADDSNEKATFGFTCKVDNVVYTTSLGYLDPISWDSKGHFTYIDHESGVKIIGNISSAEEVDDNSYRTGSFTGWYDPDEEVEDDEGEFTVTAIDYGEPAVLEGDWFEINVSGGLYDGYHNEGTIGGGNIQTEIPKDE